MTGRRIVVHHCRPGSVSPGLFTPGDAVFFDDCLWSQYRFVLDNVKSMRGVRVVMGFSPGLARPSGAAPIRFMESYKAHAAVNRAMSAPGDPPPDEIRAFMSVDEVRELSEIDGVEIAMHGCMHLKLEPVAGKARRLELFRRDAEAGAELFGRCGFRAGVFVYPYAFCEDGYDYAVKRLGFRESYAKPGAYRIAVENLDDEHSCIEDS